MTDEIQQIEQYRKQLENGLNQLVTKIGTIQIAPPDRFPFGWRKAAKGRTVWRLLEEAITQNLEIQHQHLGILSFSAAESEVGISDFSCSLDGQTTVFVNIKSAVQGQKSSKDDISKARKLADFFNEDPQRILFIATFEISFRENMQFSLENCTVMPVMWLPDIYVNPSNNGNIQSSKYKSLDEAVRRSGLEFLGLLREAIAAADAKRSGNQRPNSR